jgi:hypothetical protein
VGALTGKESSHLKDFYVTWDGQMNENELTRRIMECKSKGVRGRGRPILGWMVGVGDELSKLGSKEW